LPFPFPSSPFLSFKRKREGGFSSGGRKTGGWGQPSFPPSPPFFSPPLRVSTRPGCGISFLSRRPGPNGPGLSVPPFLFSQGITVDKNTRAGPFFFLPVLTDLCPSLSNPVQLPANLWLVAGTPENRSEPSPAACAKKVLLFPFPSPPPLFLFLGCFTMVSGR